MIEPFEQRPDPWGDTQRHVGRYGAPYFVPEVIDRAKGSYIYTEEGRKILDFTSGQMSSTLGHSHPDVVATMREACDRLDHLFSGMLSRPSINLCTHIAQTVPDPLNKVIPLSTGSEVNEAALRMAKIVTGKFEVVSFSRSWHGLTEAAGGATYSSARKNTYPTVPGQLAIPTPYEYRPDFVDEQGNLDWRKQLDYGFEMVDAQSVGSLAACIVEPILSGGGILVPPPGYLAALKQKCHERGMLLIFDEAQTSFGRTGNWYGFQHDDVTPDILTLSKTLGAGLPLAALVTTDEIEQQAKDNGFVFFTSHVNDPLVAAVGCTVMNVIERDNLIQETREKGDYLAKALKAMVEKHEVVGDARGRGLLQGIEIVRDKKRKERSEEIGDLITQECFKRGLHMNIVCLPGMGGVFRIAPPLTVTYAELDEGIQILDNAISEVEKTLLN
ncbi:aspartate aminotransferase family protein [Alteromonas lipolytica]|uniref:2,2-dialkylglycine decarboxylase n=1 Tax=Alteromonas lipolytica TaxID=1856405 RepID=A0A1E8FBV0_9ALTE|nr:aspartate aminotransferase family protein [Alteromonas lipolytica]OFI33407.1 2,2-dialkylglycine decarboxylase [Alteromonas lipolytica]GGF59975.1 aspartate aminotransferase family protein [Alteromonas lipolytica]